MRPDYRTIKFQPFNCSASFCCTHVGNTDVINLTALDLFPTIWRIACYDDSNDSSTLQRKPSIAVFMTPLPGNWLDYRGSTPGSSRN